MWLVALAVAALAIWLARGRRRIELRALAIGVLAVGLLMLAVRRAAGGYLVDKLAKDDSVKPAVQDAWNILTQVLADRAWVWITLGVLTLVGVWFVGDTRRAGQARRAALPVLQNRLATYGIAAGSVLVLALIAPLFARGWATTRVTLALAIVGVEVIRNIVLREAERER
jgi:ACR3 family arsenite efflux pump ArsB